MTDAAVGVAVALSAVIIAATSVVVAIKASRMLELLLSGNTIVTATGLPYGDIELLSLGEVDRADSIKEFFEWKHKALLKIVELGVGFLLANALLILKLGAGSGSEEVKVFRDLVGLDLQATTIVIVASVALVVGVASARVRRLPDEYMISVTFLAWLRGF
jgi:hypothetical protein